MLLPHAVDDQAEVQIVTFRFSNTLLDLTTLHPLTYSPKRKADLGATPRRQECARFASRQGSIRMVWRFTAGLERFHKSNDSVEGFLGLL